MDTILNTANTQQPAPQSDTRMPPETADAIREYPRKTLLTLPSRRW